MNILNYICFLFLILITYSCSNTRVVVEGVKTVINKTKEQPESEKKEKEDNSYVRGHYKVGNPYKINNITYIPKLVSYYNENGIASWYGPKFNKKPTANGEIFDQDKISAAHKTLPLPSIVKVTNLNNQKFIYIRVNDRGPFVNNRIIDLSKKAAMELNIFSKGIESVNVKLIESGPHLLEKIFINQQYLEKYARNLESSKSKQSKEIKMVNFLQLGVFSLEENAIEYKKKFNLKYKNSKIKVFIKKYADEKILFKVLLGPFLNIENAKNVADNLLELGYNSLIVTNKEN
ncbi:MAG: RlpA-like protein [Alphaproteobacteria bacterium MarineAlpha9_Bin4]|nr:hypothetical protein [Pelagibacterales bacterium]PPR27584.1 MAG: RlpA-like protein [Alphaproteobacteria bacterium MarineAlpha9_Bin4]|tara:strand:- start:381 stop:1250 length:870 start_codon:yes stop_codon:yes gene_type:complete